MCQCNVSGWVARTSAANPVPPLNPRHRRPRRHSRFAAARSDGGALPSSLPTLLVGTLLLASCQAGDSRGGADAGATDLPMTEVSAPPEAILHAEVLSASAAARVGGDWFVLDGLAGRLHRVDSDAGLVSSFGRSGEGPGELELPIDISSYGPNVAVLDGLVIEIFDTEGNHLDERRFSMNDCPMPALRKLVELDTGLAVRYGCYPGRDADRVAIATDEGGWLEVIGEDPLGIQEALAGLSTDLSRFHPVMAAYDGGFVMGYAEDECLTAYALNGVKTGDVCHSRLPRHPLPDNALGAIQTQLLEDREASEGELAALEEIMADMTLPKSLPPFDFAIGGEEGLIYRMLVPRSEDPLDSAATLGVLSEDGFLRWPVPAADYLFTDGISILAGWQELEGVRIEVYDVSGL